MSWRLRLISMLLSKHRRNLRRVWLTTPVSKKALRINSASKTIKSQWRLMGMRLVKRTSMVVLVQTMVKKRMSPWVGTRAEKLKMKRSPILKMILIRRRGSQTLSLILKTILIRRSKTDNPAVSKINLVIWMRRVASKSHQRLLRRSSQPNRCGNHHL